MPVKTDNSAGRLFHVLEKARQTAAVAMTNLWRNSVIINQH